MKRVLIAILVLMFVFALIRISTSTYENINRQKDELISNVQMR